MAANQYGIDLGEIYRTTAAVKGARARNRLADLQLQETEREIKGRPEKERKALERKNILTELRQKAVAGDTNAAQQLLALDPEGGAAFIDAVSKMDERKREIKERPEKERKALERKNILTGLRQKAVAGDTNAAQQLLALDPEGGATFINAVSKMDERKRKAAQRSVDEMGQLSAYVLQGSTPEEQNRRYQLMYQGVSPDVQAKLPEQFDPQFMEMSLSKAMAMDKILENPKAIQVGGEDVVYQQGREIERAKRPVKPVKGTDAGAGLKSADESLMYRQAGELLGGVFDKKGKLLNLDPATRNRVQAIATEAVKMFKQRGNISRTEAVQLAGRKFGLNIPDPSGPMGNDPLGLRN